MSSPLPDAQAVLTFWFGPDASDPNQVKQQAPRWFSGTPEFDQEVREKFQQTLELARAGEHRTWKLTPQGTLALILIFDQFSRNIHRALPAAFENDERALALCRDGVVQGIDRELTIAERCFFYLPLEHAEDIEAQDRSVACFSALHDEAPEEFRRMTKTSLDYAIEHREIIHQFGRFPHRNLILDRPSNAQEIEWLGDHGNRFGQG